MHPDYNKLDNPAWFALNETHSHLGEGTALFKRYNPDLVLFAGFDTNNETSFDELDEVVNKGQSIFLFGNIPALPADFAVATTVECLQMVCPSPRINTISESIVKLSETNAEEMFDLVTKVFPGYYLPHTNRLGDYFGIFKEGKLVSMAGERLCMNGLKEISAVVTHPHFTGRGYAQQLMTHIHQKHSMEDVVSFLHTGSGNERAIKLYRLLGYEKRRIITVTKITRRH